MNRPALICTCQFAETGSQIAHAHVGPRNNRTSPAGSVDRLRFSRVGTRRQPAFLALEIILAQSLRLLRPRAAVARLLMLISCPSGSDALPVTVTQSPATEALLIATLGGAFGGG